MYRFFDELLAHMWVNSEGVLGPSSSQGDVQSVICRSFQWVRGDGGPDALDIEPDERLVRILLDQFLLYKGCKTVVTPASKARPMNRSIYSRSSSTLRSGRHVCLPSVLLKTALTFAVQSNSPRVTWHPLRNRDWRCSNAWCVIWPGHDAWCSGL